MCIPVTNQQIPVEKEQPNSPAESGVHVRHLVLSERHTAFMKLAMPSLAGQLFTDSILLFSPPPTLLYRFGSVTASMILFQRNGYVYTVNSNGLSMMKTATVFLQRTAT